MPRRTVFGAAIPHLGLVWPQELWACLFAALRGKALRRCVHMCPHQGMTQSLHVSSGPNCTNFIVFDCTGAYVEV